MKIKDCLYELKHKVSCLLLGFQLVFDDSENPGSSPCNNSWFKTWAMRNTATGSRRCKNPHILGKWIFDLVGKFSCRCPTCTQCDNNGSPNLWQFNDRTYHLVDVFLAWYVVHEVLPCATCCSSSEQSSKGMGGSKVPSFSMMHLSPTGLRMRTG